MRADCISGVIGPANSVPSLSANAELDDDDHFADQHLADMMNDEVKHPPQPEDF